MVHRSRRPRSGLELFVLMVCSAGCDAGRNQGSTYVCPPGECCGQPATGTGSGALPARPSAPAITSTTASVFAVSKFDFGDLDSAGSPSTTAWKTRGLNIDGKVTCEASRNVCTPVAGATRYSQIDGNDGIDNSFGENLLPIILEINPQYSGYANALIRKGAGTLLFELDGLGAFASSSRLPGALLRALPTSQSLHWDGSDARDVDSVTVVGGDPSRPLAIVPNAFMNDRVWVSGPASAAAYLDLQVTSGGAGSSSGFLPPIPLQHVQVAMSVAAGNGAVTSGTVSGVLRTADARTWVSLWAQSVSTSFCYASAGEAITSSIEQASDIMEDGSNEPGKTCDGISVGLGFDGVAVQLGQSEAQPAFPDPCADGGTDASSNGD